MTSGVPFSQFMEGALYDPEAGFYAGEGRAGRRGDFLTSPEVGPLFGALVAERIDREWERLGRPDAFVAVDAGAGPGALARAVALAGPRCASCLRYVSVEVSDAQRRRHAEHLDGWIGDLDAAALERFVTDPAPGLRFASSSALPMSFDGIVIANELLDNLPFDIVRSTPTGFEMLVVGGDGEERRAESVPVDLPDDTVDLFGRIPPGAWVPWQHRARRWVDDVRMRIGRGSLVVLDYAATTSELADRGLQGWLRTYLGHERGDDPLVDPGSRDITADVDLDQLSLDRLPDVVATQRDWLVGLGLDTLVTEGRRIWHERSTSPDVVALRGRSRIGEAEALCDPDGLGAFTVLEWHCGPAAGRRADR